MQSLFKQTRTKVHSPAGDQQQRMHGLSSAARAMAAIQLGTQLLIWITFYGYDLAAQAIWQAALMLIVPLIILWLIWKKADMDHPAARWWMLPLLICLLLDTVMITTLLGGFVSQLVRHAPVWVCTVFPAAVCMLTALRARLRGVRYGSAVLTAPLVILLVFGTLFLRASTRADRLWPILGDGILSTAKSALLGAGGTWGAALLFVLPKENRSSSWKTWGWAVLPWAMCVLWALWFGFVRPWAVGDTISIAEKMMGLARHANSVLLYETAGVMWMLLLPAALTACLSAGETILSRAFPRFPRWMALLIPGAAAVSVPLIWPDIILSLLGAALPWRYAVSLICGLGLMLTGRRRA